MLFRFVAAEAKSAEVRIGNFADDKTLGNQNGRTRFGRFTARRQYKRNRRVDLCVNSMQSLIDSCLLENRYELTIHSADGSDVHGYVWTFAGQQHHSGQRSDGNIYLIVLQTVDFALSRDCSYSRQGVDVGGICGNDGNISVFVPLDLSEIGKVGVGDRLAHRLVDQASGFGLNFCRSYVHYDRHHRTPIKVERSDDNQN